MVGGENIGEIGIIMGGWMGTFFNPSPKSESRNHVSITCEVWSEGLQHELRVRDRKINYFGFRALWIGFNCSIEHGKK